MVDKVTSVTVFWDEDLSGVIGEQCGGGDLFADDVVIVSQRNDGYYQFDIQNEADMPSPELVKGFSQLILKPGTGLHVCGSDDGLCYRANPYLKRFVDNVIRCGLTQVSEHADKVFLEQISSILEGGQSVYRSL